MWTPATRRQHSRDHLRYGSDLSDAEWEILAPFMPAPARTGRPRQWPMSSVLQNSLKAGFENSLIGIPFGSSRQG